MRRTTVAATSCTLATALAAFSLFTATPAHATDQVPASVTAALSKVNIPLASTAILVQPLDSHTPLLRHNGEVAMNPASVMKLVTTYAALQALGPSYTWKTRFYRDNGEAASPNATLDNPENSTSNVLVGNLYIQGGGDPLLNGDELRRALRAVRRQISRIEGDIVLDRSHFRLHDIDPGAFDQQPSRPYNVPPNGLLLDLQTLALDFSLSPDRQQVRVSSGGDASLTIHNRLTINPKGGCGRDWDDAIAVRGNDDLSLTISGSYPAACATPQRLYSAPFAANQHAALLLTSLWRELGGELGGTVRSASLEEHQHQKHTLIHTHQSPPLSTAIVSVNKFSNNVMARQLYLSLPNLALAENRGNGSAEKSLRAAAITPEDARIHLLNTLATERLSFPELVIDNGAGLSRKARISADSLNRLLRAAWHSPVMPEFAASLPLMGLDGTLRRHLKDSPARGRARLKTGSLNGVRALAGYVESLSGRRYSVIFLINHAQANQPDTRLAWHRLVEWLMNDGKNATSEP